MPVHIEPEFAMIYAGALAFQRATQKRPEIILRIFPSIVTTEHNAVGPCTRTYELLDTPLGPVIQELIDGHVVIQMQI